MRVRRASGCGIRVSEAAVQAGEAHEVYFSAECEDIRVKGVVDGDKKPRIGV